MGQNVKIVMDERICERIRKIGEGSDYYRQMIRDGLNRFDLLLKKANDSIREEND